MEVIFDAVARNVAVLDPIATVTLAGTERAVLLLASPTAMGTTAFLSKVTVQVADWLLPSVEGLQDSDESAGTNRDRTAVRVTALRLTVMVAV